jgi:hypothetical protein
VNGDFNFGTCLAEAFMRSTDSANAPTGAVATFMSTINQSWDPPMDAQDEMVDLLIESYPANMKHTFGGISVNGCMHMNDQYGSGGDEMTDTWTIFGDPSLMLRTNTPHVLNVAHNATIDASETTFTVYCPDDGSLVCLSKNGSIVATAWTLAGSGTLNFTGLNNGDTLDIVVTGYNAIGYFGHVIVTSSTTDISDVSGNRFTVYPNPASDVLTVHFQEKNMDGYLRLINALGQITYSHRIENSTQAVISVHDFSSGVYSIVVEREDGGIEISRIIVD